MITLIRLAIKLTSGVITLAVIYMAVTFGQIWWEARRDETQPAPAIVVFGAAQYDGRPSAVLKARLDHAVDLYRRGLAPLVVVTGGRQPGDHFTEATVSANHLLASGVPESAILREVSGASSWQSLSAAAGILADRGVTEALLVSDPFHSLRIEAIASELGLVGHVSPTRTSPITGGSELRAMGRETLAVSMGRVIGFRRQANIDEVVRSGTSVVRL